MLGTSLFSYVREDGAQVDRLQAALQAAGLPVWRDTKDIAPGDQWKARLRDAIGADALAFLPCFSANTQRRTRSTMYAELIWAAEEYRLRNPAVPWIFPVLFEECEVPRIDLGGDRSLADLHWTNCDEPLSLQRLLATLLRLLPAHGPTSVDIMTVQVLPGLAHPGSILTLEIQVEVVGGPEVAWIGATLTDEANREHYDPMNDVATRLHPGPNVGCLRVLPTVGGSIGL